MKPRISILLIYILLLVAAANPSISDNIAKIDDNLNIKIEQNNELKLFSDASRWLKQLENAASILPEETLGDITSKDSLLIEFRSEPKEWHTGTYRRNNNSITINTAPNPDHPFPYEYFSENGYTDQEILFVWLHELGHAWDYGNNYLGRTASFSGEGSPSLYGYVGYTNNGKIRKSEAFAEAFALYVTLPRYLKNNFPAHYEWLKEEAFVRKEYDILFNPQNSILSRFSK